jgi:hypothetical protein
VTTLRVRLAAPPLRERGDAWALFDTAGACSRVGVDRPDAWPAADRLEVVLAASQLRIASIKLPPMAASRVAGAAGFALEDQLAGPADAHYLAPSAQAPDGRVNVVIVERSLIADIARVRGGIARMIAESELALPITGWRWCQGEDGAGFVRCADGSAFAVGPPTADGGIPSELALALAHARRDGTLPPLVRVDAAIPEPARMRWQNETGIAFPRGAPWKWHEASAAAFTAATNLAPDTPGAPVRLPTRRVASLFAPAALLVGAALAIHVLATLGAWTSLRYSAWRDAREWTALAVAAGVPPESASTMQSARTALARRYAELRHAHAMPAPDDALPLLARAAPALAAIPPETVKSATYADGHWTLDVAPADPATIRNVDARMRAAGVPMLAALSATGARLRLGGP